MCTHCSITKLHPSVCTSLCPCVSRPTECWGNWLHVPLPSVNAGLSHYCCCWLHMSSVHISSRRALVQVGIFQVVYLGLSAEDAYQKVQQLQPFVPFRDASCGPPSFNLSVQHCIMVSLNLAVMCYRTYVCQSVLRHTEGLEYQRL